MNNTSSITTMAGATVPGIWDHNFVLIIVGLLVGYFGNKALDYLWNKFMVGEKIEKKIFKGKK